MMFYDVERSGCLKFKKKLLRWSFHSAENQLLRQKRVEDHHGSIQDLPSGNLLHSYGKLPFIADLPIKNGDFP